MFQTFENTSGSQHVADRVKALRAALAKVKVDAVLVPRADEHQGEYVPPSAERLKWLTGFSGSAGIAIVTRKAAVLVVDGRYTVQAKAETDTDLFEVSLLPRPRISEWIANALPKGSTVGFDPWLHTSAEISRLTKALAPKGITLKPLAKNAVDGVWGDDRPAPPTAPAVPQPLQCAGRSSAEKLAALQKQLKDDGQHAVVLTLPDSICWLFNIRGSDVAHNPVVLAFAIVPATGKAELFIDPTKIADETRAHLSPTAKISTPDQLKPRLEALRDTARRVRIDGDTAAYWFERTLGAKSAVFGQDPCIVPKAIKTASEIAGSRSAHERDGAAVTRFLAWLDETAQSGDVDEISAVRQLEAFRDATGKLKEISFATISGSGSNGAIVHYRVTDATNRVLNSGELFLVDSGGQYEDGTTDITRTVAIGEPNDEMRQRYTAVLKGHISIATARFPKGTRGIDLDPFARRALWDIGVDFDHGTGHGIGSYLSVHEGPQSISRAGMAVLQPGMLLSNEPGYYKEGAYGIRLENVVLVTELQDVAGGDRQMMSFETLTLAPFDRRLIDPAMLTTAELQWLNDYHARVLKELAPRVDTLTAIWLARATEPITQRT
ncbi:MAG: aminopeptidase P family protein [Hyphomicrobium sp.]|nr:aminopeptidase P family protein [Hyphomicrobium sp.]